ncbi:MAG: hypothetical protein A2538_03315 [Candidatus Magasanikbacteria bacterium RIFOXYD2_FULL_41_14]|uniref:SHSP domain-containing protein n=1 Tax=Candidatus Magasanikbacteria bacterium RIFOXYD2_FULL_41_14 TaxID=1798709 RepID=A0A1F6PCG9_9BACT|nr:MAG: hypothetical protein A2538_03315 [Candidatus Magasanikbacteria bacterium RIFOXYD2_FULL_41_14]
MVITQTNNMLDDSQSILLGADGLRIVARVANENFSGPHPEPEGQLSIDVGETDAEIIVVATMAGTAPDRIELHLHNDVLTIRGERQSPLPDTAQRFYSECYWGRFSRTIVLPAPVRPELASAEYKFGALIIHLTKIKNDSSIPIYVVEE